jgi:hypothetical protein
MFFLPATRCGVLPDLKKKFNSNGDGYGAGAFP